MPLMPRHIHAGSRHRKKGGYSFSSCEHTCGSLSFDITLVLSGTPAYVDIVCQCPINVADEDDCKESEQEEERRREKKKREEALRESVLFFGRTPVLKELALSLPICSSSIRLPS